MDHSYISLINQYGPFVVLCVSAAALTLIAYLITRISSNLVLLISGIIFIGSLAVYLGGIFVKPSIAGLNPGQLSSFAAIAAALSGPVVSFYLVRRMIENMLWAIILNLCLTAGAVYLLIYGLLNTFGK